MLFFAWLRRLLARRGPAPQIVMTCVGGELRVCCNLPDFSEHANDEILESASYLAAACYALTGGDPAGLGRMQEAVALAGTRRDDKFFAEAFLAALNGAVADNAGGDDSGRDRPAIRASQTFSSDNHN